MLACFSFFAPISLSFSISSSVFCWYVWLICTCFWFKRKINSKEVSKGQRSSHSGLLIIRQAIWLPYWLIHDLDSTSENQSQDLKCGKALRPAAVQKSKTHLFTWFKPYFEICSFESFFVFEQKKKEEENVWSFSDDFKRSTQMPFHPNSQCLNKNLAYGYWSSVMSMMRTSNVFLICAVFLYSIHFVLYTALLWTDVYLLIFWFLPCSTRRLLLLSHLHEAICHSSLRGIKRKTCWEVSQGLTNKL